MKRFIAIAAAAALWVGVSFAQEAPLRIGVFELGRISQETAEGQRIQKSLMDFQDKKKAELDAKEKELKDMQEQLATLALSLAPERRSQMEKDLQKKQNELVGSREGAQREWQIEFNEAQDKFLQKVRDVVEAFGREEKFTLILERDSTVFRSDSVDLTRLIIERFNKMSPPPPAAAAPPSPAKQPPKPAPTPGAAR
jgi:outer membrane protein